MSFEYTGELISNYRVFVAYNLALSGPAGPMKTGGFSVNPAVLDFGPASKELSKIVNIYLATP